MTNNVREALEAYPLKFWLQRGSMDLKPSLAIHLAEMLDTPPAPEGGDVAELVGQLLELAREWRMLAGQMPATERAVVMTECVNGLMQLLEADR